MAKNNLFDFSTTAGDNTDIAGASVAENQLPSSLNDSIRALCAIVLRACGNKGSDIASSSTCPIAADATSFYCVVTGTTAITGFGTVRAGTFRIVEFADVLTLTHSAALLLPGLANITTAAGDIAELVSLGSGNWKCTSYTRQSGEVVGGFSSVTATSTDAGATAGPDVSVFRNSSSPGDADLIGRYLFEGRDESSNRDIYGSLEGKILDATHGTEDAEIYVKTVVAGTLAARLTAGQGIQVGAPTGGDKGVGTINADNGIYKDDVLISSGTIQTTIDISQSLITDSTHIPYDSSTPLVTEGTQAFSRSFTPRSAASTLIFDVNLQLGGTWSTGEEVIVALFEGSTCLAVGFAEGLATNGGRVPFTHSAASANTTARTYSVRFGAGSADTHLNRGNPTSNSLGGKIVSSFKITEVL